MRNSSLISLAVVLVGGAIAATGDFGATLQQPLAAKKEVMVVGNLFRCDGTTCTVISSVTNDLGGISACRALQRQVGTLASYVAYGKPFDAEKLAKCNAHS